MTPEVVTLEKCPACQEFGIPPETGRGFRFCLKCQWHEPFIRQAEVPEHAAE